FESLRGTTEQGAPTLRNPFYGVAHQDVVVPRSAAGRVPFLGALGSSAKHVRRSVSQESNLAHYVGTKETARVNREFWKLVRALPRQQRKGLMDAVEGLHGLTPQRAQQFIEGRI